MTQEALKLALEALEDALNKPMWNRPQMTTAITAIKEALAQTQESPQRTWVGLTDEEWLSLGCKSVEEVRIGLAIQAKLKEKNA